MQILKSHPGLFWDFLGGASGKETACHCRRGNRPVGSLGGDDPLEEGRATSSSILAWRIPLTVTWWATIHRVLKSQGGLQLLSAGTSRSVKPRKQWMVLQVL